MECKKIRHFIFCLFILSLIVFSSCTSQQKSVLPDDKTILDLLDKSYTQNNQLDGSEFATVDSLYIIKKESKGDGICEVRYHIQCSYQPAVMPSGNEQTAPPPLIRDSLAVLKLNGNMWKLAE